VLKARDRDQASHLLVKAAAALAVHRARTGQYPDALEELAPAVLPQLPPDPYTGRPLVYRKKPDGYLLYSMYENGVDDGGTDRGGELLNGEWIATDEIASPSEAADLVIRLPMPPLKPLVKSPAATTRRVDGAAESAPEPASTK
jgi:hypothetical protein